MTENEYIELMSAYLLDNNQNNIENCMFIINETDNSYLNAANYLLEDDTIDSDVITINEVTVKRRKRFQVDKDGSTAAKIKWTYYCSDPRYAPIVKNGVLLGIRLLSPTEITKRSNNKSRVTKWKQTMGHEKQGQKRRLKTVKKLMNTFGRDEINPIKVKSRERGKKLKSDKDGLIQQKKDSKLNNPKSVAKTLIGGPKQIWNG